MSELFVQDRPCEALALNAASAALEGLREVRLIPDGETVSKKGRIVLDADAARTVIEAFEKHRTPLVIDWEHETLGTGRAPAAGWVEKLYYQPGRGLMGLVRWNDDARAEIRAGHYGYLSSVVAVEKETGRVAELHSAGLTNKPALPGMERLAASGIVADAVFDEPGDSVQDTEVIACAGGKALEILKQIKAELGLGDGVGVEGVLAAALEKVKAGKAAEVVAASVRTRLELKDDAGVGELLAAFDARLTQKSTREAELEAEAMVEAAIKEGKCGRGDKKKLAWLKELAMKDRTMAEDVLAHMYKMPMPPPGSIVRDHAPSRDQCVRSKAILDGVRAFRDDPTQAKLTSEKAFVGMFLRDRNQSPLTDEEIRFIGTLA